MLNTVFLIHSGDKNEWVFPHWFRHYRAYFTDECRGKIDTVFLTETSNFFKSKPCIIQANTGCVPWSDGLIDFLLTCKYRNIIYTHEDYFLTETVDHKKLFKLIDIFENNNMNLLKICGWWAGYIDDKAPHQKTDMLYDDSTDRDRVDTDYIWLYNNNCDYLVSHQTSIWARDFLLQTLTKNITPWDHELAMTKYVRSLNIPIHAYRGKSPLEYAETVVHGKIRDNAKHFFEGGVENV